MKKIVLFAESRDLYPHVAEITQRFSYLCS